MAGRHAFIAGEGLRMRRRSAAVGVRADLSVARTRSSREGTEASSTTEGPLQDDRGALRAGPPSWRAEKKPWREKGRGWHVRQSPLRWRGPFSARKGRALA